MFESTVFKDLIVGSVAGEGTCSAAFIADYGLAFYNGGTAITQWTDGSDNGLTSDLHSVLFSGDDPRPIHDSEKGLYLNNQSGLTVSDGVLSTTEQDFAIFFCFDVDSENISNFDLKSDADSAGGTEGDKCKVTADATTIYTPDFDNVFDAGFSDSMLINGYYNRTLSEWKTMHKYELWSLQNDSGGYCNCFINRLGQLSIVTYGGSGNVAELRTRAIDVMGVTGPQMVALRRQNGIFTLYHNGLEVSSVDGSGLVEIDDFARLYFNSNTRTANPAIPVNGLRHYVKGWGAFENITDIGFCRAYNAFAQYSKTRQLRKPLEVFGIIHSGQSWAQGAISINDTWLSNNSWDGQVDVANATHDGSDNRITTEFLQGVLAHQSQNYNADIGVLGIQLNQYGNIASGDSHGTGIGETTDFGLMKQVLNNESAPDIDWILTKSHAGGATIDILSNETSPPWLVQTLKAKSISVLTYYEELLQSVVHARDYARARSRIYRCAAFFWQQGHSDMSNADYVSDFLAYYDKLNASIKRITGQSDDVVCIMPQINYSTNGVVNRANLGTSIDQKILDIVANREARPIYCIGPMYQITNFIHSYRRGYRWAGEIAGKILARVLFDGQDAQNLYPTGFTKTGNNVDIEFNVPVGSLQFVDANENNISGRVAHNNVDTCGFEYSKNEGAATITAASPGVVTWTGNSLSDDDKVTFWTTGDLPTGLSPNTDYYVVNHSGGNTFELSESQGGAAINTSGSQSGAHTIFDTSISIDAVTIQDANTVRLSLSSNPDDGHTIRYTGRTCRFGNLCDQDTAEAYYRDQDWTGSYSGNSPNDADGELHDLRNWCCAFTEILGV